MMMLQTQVIAVVILLVGGAHTSDIDTKISKGPRAKGNPAPFSVYLGYNGTQVVCGGSLVHDDLVLTLAACVRGCNSSLITVTAGHRKLYKTEGETKHTVNEIVEYPGNSNISTDVVLLRLESPVNTSLPRVGTTVLSDMAPTLEDSCVLSAYGDTGRAREFKQSLDIVVLNSIDVCDGFVNGSSRCYQPRKQRHQGKKMACDGDQGSPITCELNGTIVQVGINLASSCESIRLAARNVNDVTAWVSGVINPTTECKGSIPMVTPLPDSQFSASSEWQADNAASRARLNDTNCWNADYDRAGEYLQVDFSEPRVVTSIITRGDADVSEWVKTYKVLISNDCTIFTAITNASGTEKIFDGNVDGGSDAENTLEPPVVTRCLRIEAVTFHNWISLRLEAMGCLA